MDKTKKTKQGMELPIILFATTYFFLDSILLFFFKDSWILFFSLVAVIYISGFFLLKKKPELLKIKIPRMKAYLIIFGLVLFNALVTVIRVNTIGV